MPDGLPSSVERKKQTVQFRSQSADKNQQCAMLSVIYRETSGLMIRKINIPEEYICAAGEISMKQHSVRVPSY